MEFGITTSAEIGFRPTKVRRSAAMAVENGRGNKCIINEVMEVVVNSLRGKEIVIFRFKLKTRKG